ncbi:MAG: permease-like cell division protein FtsX [Candidatus Pacebacteria bacterium]|nr:permease-like cell division protein FtsX [Candidatus Paceibacterota bacterium]MCF7862697.1 permease-like cell division protein FtsX [Candidatus Paceibacterota bacterium]
MIKILRIIKAGFISFKRSGTISFASVLIMTVTLSVVTSIILLQASLNFSLNQIKEKVDITIYFTVKAPESQILSLKDSISKLPEVQSATYVSAEESLALFRARHSGDYATIAALDEINENPLGGYLNIKANDVSQYESLAETMKADNGLVSGADNIIDKINYHDNKVVIDRLNSIISGAQKLGVLVTLILIIISVIITLNTIRLAIFISKEEIGVMRLVGASRNAVRGPFMVEGLIYGVVATFITSLLFIPASIWMGNNMTGFLGLNLKDYYLSNFVQIFVLIGLFGMILGIISSFLAIGRYLNK